MGGWRVYRRLFLLVAPGDSCYTTNPRKPTGTTHTRGLPGASLETPVAHSGREQPVSRNSQHGWPPDAGHPRRRHERTRLDPTITSWRQGKAYVKNHSSLGRRHGHHETRREALPRQWRSDAGQWRTMSSPQDVGGVVVSEEQRGGARVRGVMAKFGRGINHPKVKNLPNTQRSGNRGTPMVPGSTAGHATGSQMVQLGSSRRVTLYSASITASARPPAPPGQWWRSCGWA